MTNLRCFCVDPDPSNCAACRVGAYRARDARISIGLPIKQDNGELEYPGYVDGVLVNFYARPGLADVALHNILDTGLVALLPAFRATLDNDYAPVGWPE